MKKYIIITRDVIWNNLEIFGIYKSLQEANEQLRNGTPEGYDLIELSESHSAIGTSLTGEMRHRDEEDENIDIYGFAIDEKAIQSNITLHTKLREKERRF